MIGSDLFASDINIMDLSISAKHAEISLDKGGNKLFIEDLKSKNGTSINGKSIQNKSLIKNGDVVRLGVSSFIVVDSTVQSSTIDIQAEEKDAYDIEGRASGKTPGLMSDYIEAKTAEMKKFSYISYIFRWLRNNGSSVLGPLIISLVGIAFIASSCVLMYMVFKSEDNIMMQEMYPERKIAKAISGYDGIKFMYSRGAGNLLLSGNLVTNKEHKDILYKVAGLECIRTLIDRVVVDEHRISEVIDAIYYKPAWRSVRAISKGPGVIEFLGFVKNTKELKDLMNYIGY